MKSSVPVGVFPEKVFRHLADREFKRSERSGHSFRILLVYRHETQRLGVLLDAELLDKTISVLSRCCRDTDYIGWYRQDRILGVLLTALHPDFAKDGCEKLKSRLLTGLRDARTFPDGYSLQVRVLQQEELTAFNAYDNPTPFPGSKD
ncbi:MAG: hypothetical protein KF693_01005 [Nitrospira sp.]|nr:hypothetical protein [Nitrospira sp.]